jgi:hypothetical protein
MPVICLEEASDVFGIAFAINVVAVTMLRKEAPQ